MAAPGLTPRQHAALLPDGRRLHLQDGPIDLIVGADGSASAVAAARAAAVARFATILDELCAELALLRRPPDPDEPPAGAVARRMWQAALPWSAQTFVTPMAAVAGAVAEAVLAAMVTAAPLTRAYVNDGGDIALFLTPGTQVAIGLIDRPDRPSLFGRAAIGFGDPVRGIATSGWRGRSFSLGIADAVTVLARTAPEADVAATLIGNAVDLPDEPRIVRVPACELAPDNDLGERPVTRAVPALARASIDAALERGAAVARAAQRLGRIDAAALHLQGITRIVGAAPADPAEPREVPAHA